MVIISKWVSKIHAFNYFPFSVIYREHDDLIYVVAVMS